MDNLLEDFERKIKSAKQRGDKNFLFDGVNFPTSLGYHILDLVNEAKNDKESFVRKFAQGAAWNSRGVMPAFLTGTAVGMAGHTTGNIKLGLAGNAIQLAAYLYKRHKGNTTELDKAKKAVDYAETESDKNKEVFGDRKSKEVAKETISKFYRQKSK